MSVELEAGVLRLSGTELSLDSNKRRALAFVSHAHADHVAPHQHAVCTPATAALVAQRPNPALRFTTYGYGEWFDVPGAMVSFVPAGHMLGAAQLHARLSSGTSVVYSGDISDQTFLTAKQLIHVEADVLVMEATFGHPKYRFPPRAEALEQLRSWISRQLDDGRAAVIRAYAFGKGQEVVSLLNTMGLVPAIPPNMAAACQVYVEHGVPLGWRPLGDELVPGEVAVLPPRGRGGGGDNFRRHATCVVSGWSAGRGTGVAAGLSEETWIPLSDHCDFDGLVRYAERSKAREVITVHGYARELAEVLRGRGMCARAADERLQLSLDALWAEPLAQNREEGTLNSLG